MTKRTGYEGLQASVRRWRLRLRLVESLTWGTWGVTVGVGLALLVALVARLRPLVTARQVAGLAGALALAGGAIAVAVAWLRPRSPLRLAHIFDRRFGMAQRLTTALEIDAGRLRVVPAMAQAQLDDTLAAARQADPRRALPFRAPAWALRSLAIAAVALALLLALPNPQQVILVQQAALEEAIEEQIEDLEALQEQIAQAEGLTEEERQALLQALEEAVAGLEEGQATLEESLAALSEAEQQLTELQDPGAEELQAGLERAAEGMADSDLTRELAEALSRGDYQAAAEALAEYAGEKGQALSRQEELDLAQQLAEAADALSEVDPELAQQLAEAAQAIEAGDIAEAQEAIEAAAEQIDQAGERVERQETIEGTLAELQEGREQIVGSCGGT